MAGFFIKTLFAPECQVSVRDDNCTPTRLQLDDGVYAHCELNGHDVSLEVDFSWGEVSTMLATVFPRYMPTMDAAYRFMESNPQTSAEMLAEIQAKRKAA